MHAIYEINSITLRKLKYKTHCQVKTLDICRIVFTLNNNKVKNEEYNTWLIYYISTDYS